MKCEELQLNLPLYSDDCLSADERLVLDDHFVHCPLCRQKLIDFQDLRNSLRAIARPQMPATLLASLRNAAASELAPSSSTPGFALVDDRRNWREVWLMPYAAGVFSSLVIGFTLLWVIMSNDFQAGIADAANATNSGSSSGIMLARGNSPDLIELSQSEYAGSRIAFSGESPSINPSGALIALTKSLVSGGEMTDDEVVVVADVFGNGLAQITEVVEPSRDRQAVADLRKALETDPSLAPFVPANLDNRSESVRVVLKIQSVNVHTYLR
ncbi:MAG: zf-HC2 domain-containing protein [Saprospiraceae bacterium]|nr:zf-HC2 domain-containing protein [Pyrinomonadaceae bacterium]